LNWSKKRVLVTGGASFIGSHLVEKLVALGAGVVVADDLSSGRKEHLSKVQSDITLRIGDLRDRCFADRCMKDIDVVFHLAASHGGRGYIATHPAECSSNMVLDGVVFDSAYRAGVKKVCFASSACVYPRSLQSKGRNISASDARILLSENMADPFTEGKAFADEEYGWCLTGKSYILTRDGLKQIMCVQPGDLVLAKDNKWRRVLRVLCRRLRANERIIRLKPSRGMATSMTSQHKVWTSLGWRQAGEIVGYRSWRRPLMVLPEPSPPIEFPKEKNLKFTYHGYRSEIASSPELWRFIGFWLAEGTLEPHTGKNADPGYISVSQKDRKTLEKYLPIARELDPDSKINGPYADGIHILRLWHHGLWRWLHQNFLARTHFHRYRGRSKSLPLWLSGQNGEAFRAFWNGWNEGDGKHRNDRRSESVSTSSSSLAGRIYLVLRARNMPVSLSSSYNRRFQSFTISWLASDYANYGAVGPTHNRPSMVYDIEIEGESSYSIPGAFVHNSKLMGEMALKAHFKQYGMKGVSCRIFTAYGPRENESHAVVALIAKAFVEMDPYEVWGTGDQDRNFTFVEDTVDGMVRATEKIEDASPINIGTDQHITIKDLVQKIFEYTGFRPKETRFDPTKPEGVFSRAADLTMCRKLLGWEPKVPIDIGLKKTIEWYYATKNKEDVRRHLDALLFER